MVPYADYDAGKKVQGSQELLFLKLSALKFIMSNRTAPYLCNCRLALPALLKVGLLQATEIPHRKLIRTLAQCAMHVKR